MKILFFNYEYPPLGGGAANATFCILREFSKITDLEVDLITSSINEKYSVEKIGGNITIYKVPIGKNSNNLHFQSQKDLIVYAWRALILANKLIKKNKYDLTHSFFTVPCGAISLWFKLTKKIPFVISLRGSDVPGYSERFKFIYTILKPLIKLIWKKSSTVVSNSRGLRDLALETNKHQKVDIIFNGIDLDDFCPNESLRAKDRFIITIGATRITARKGTNYLVEALGILAPKYPNLLLRILGDGDEKNNLIDLTKKMKLENFVQFLGRIPREETAPYYQEASLFVLPSLNEGMSNAMLEALASGLPILATQTGGTEELVEDGINGFVIKMKDPKDLADKIEMILKDDGLRVQMGLASRKKAQEMSWKNVAQKYFELYEEIVKK
ncbi:MAG: Glycosyl transferase group 1 [Candidatus Moranbacteria bacterium GW2011_GWE1_35_17]|nr:MAG: Glycosyl transferase group 1 [Candidatus Moranbacteria bacterium GW2011_GWE1_35_17]KKP84260.1 MAG: Glycosyl transferase group 1 [Candidatus Moranbacteria bacterium GW2011_GWF1_35_5]